MTEKKQDAPTRIKIENPILGTPEWVEGVREAQEHIWECAAIDIEVPPAPGDACPRCCKCALVLARAVRAYQKAVAGQEVVGYVCKKCRELTVVEDYERMKKYKVAVECYDGAEQYTDPHCGGTLVPVGEIVKVEVDDA